MVAAPDSGYDAFAFAVTLLGALCVVRTAHLLEAKAGLSKADTRKLTHTGE